MTQSSKTAGKASGSHTDSRSLMELAVRVMRESVAEERSDGKACPKVGAVLLLPDGKVTTAYRGELREGDHAEYTLLERKHRDSKLDGSILFATLEPCAPKARQHPKLGCAERVVLARIKEVWIGIEDPDPTVDRKGIKYLQDNGITVHMFDRDLQEVIRDGNKDFIAQAMERAVAAAEEQTPEVTLSLLEKPQGNLDGEGLDELSNQALKAYRDSAGIAEEIDSLSFKKRLVRQGLLQQAGDRFTPTGFGFLLFGKEPRVIMPQAGLLATIHYADGTEEVKNFEGPQVLVPEQALQWLRDKLPNPIDRSEARRQEMNARLFELVREGIVNALVHRDYDIQGAKCQLVVRPDTIQISSPGSPVPPITVEQIRAFNAPMLSRNPVLHYVFARMALAEERGLGLTSLKNQAQSLGLPQPRYTWQDPYLKLTIFRNPAAATLTLDQNVLETLSTAEQKGWQWIAVQGQTTSSEYARVQEVPNRTALNHLKRFTDLGLLRRSGTGPSTRYEVV